MGHCRKEVSMLSGIYTAMITPFRGDEVDEIALEKLVERQVQAGVAGLSPAERPVSLSH